MARRIAVAILIGLVANTHAGTHQFEGRIAGMRDSDAMTLLGAANRQHKIRLDGIDAPELGQPFGNASEPHPADLVFNREVVADCGETNRNRREVCRVLVEPGT